MIAQRFNKEIKERAISLLEKLEKRRDSNATSFTEEGKYKQDFITDSPKQHYKNLREFLNRNSELIKKLFYDYGLSLTEIESFLKEDYGRKIERRKIRQILVKELGRKLVESRIANIKAQSRRFEKFLRLLKLDKEFRKQFLDVLFNEELGKTAKYQKLKEIIEDYFFKNTTPAEIPTGGINEEKEEQFNSDEIKKRLIRKTVEELTRKEGTLGWLIFEKFYKIFVEPYEQLREQTKTGEEKEVSEDINSKSQTQIDVSRIKEVFDNLIEQTPIVELIQEFLEEEQIDKNISLSNALSRNRKN